jgi:hypothetical protein
VVIKLLAMHFISYFAFYCKKMNTIYYTLTAQTFLGNLLLGSASEIRHDVGWVDA